MPFVESFSYANLTIAHICAIIFLSFIICISFLLLVQYIFRYRKYELATSRMVPDSPAHTLFGSDNSLNHSQQPRSRAMSTTTLISEIVSYVKLRPKKGSFKHNRLRESVEYTIENLDLPSDGSTELIGKAQSSEKVDEIPLENLNNLDHPNGSECSSPPTEVAEQYSDDQSTNVSSAYSTLNREETPLVTRREPKRTPERRNQSKSEGEWVSKHVCIISDDIFGFPTGERSPNEKIPLASSCSTVTLTNISPSDIVSNLSYDYFL